MEPSQWQLLLDRLTRTLRQKGELNQYTAAQSNAERIELCHSNDHIQEQLKNWIESVACPPETVKCKERALELKMLGNKAYAKKDNEKALMLYNQGILVSPDSDVSLLFGNRSAVLFNLHQWGECVTDIDLALERGFPTEKRWKLYKRKGEALQKMCMIGDSISCFEKCLKLLKEDRNKLCEEDKVSLMIKDLQVLHNNDSKMRSKCEDNIVDKFIPLGGFSNQVTCASEAISLVENSSEGRHFIAKQTIQPGSIVIVEEPYASVLLPDWFLSHCQHCFTKVSCYVPCRQCSQVCYCSYACQQQSWEKYHSFECGKLHIMKEIGVAHLALRIILSTDMALLSSYFDADVSKDLSSAEGAKGWRNGDLYESDYNSLYHLVTHSDDLQADDQFQYTVAATLLLQVLSSDSFFPPHTEDSVKFQVGGLILHHIQQIVCNAHAITSIESTSNISENIVEQDQVRIATALYATSSLLNHSCRPNILNTFHRNKLIIKVVSQINEGDRVSTCYGPHYRRMDFTERQNALKSQYFFTCGCTPCGKGLKAMEEFDHYICPSCRKGFNGEVKFCPHCNSDISITDLLKKSSESANLFSSGLNLMDKAHNEANLTTAIDLALAKFLNCLKLQETVYSKYHSSLGKTYDVIAKCYSVLLRYTDSLKYLKKSLCLVEAHYGKDSAELTNEYLKLCDIYFALLQKLIDRKDYHGAQKHQVDAQRAVERCIFLVELNREPDSPDLEDLLSKRESLSKLSLLTSTVVR